MENSTPSSRLAARHGLSLFLETDAGRVLFDMGPDGSFLDNARALGMDVSTAGCAVLSHGHYDHGGGLAAYLDATARAESPASVYVRRGAFGEHVSGTPGRHHPVGIDPGLRGHPRVVEVGETHEVREGLLLFSTPGRPHPEPASNALLLARGAGRLVRDTFDHEQSLLVTEGGRRLLVSGCSHAGILNVVERAEELAGGPLDAVVAGFHLMSPSAGTAEGDGPVRDLARRLGERPARYYTFHCTGLGAFSVLRDELGDRVRYLCVGSVADV